MSPPAVPDLAHAEAWLFDLDNTLYPLESGLAPQVSDLITDFTQSLTGLDRDAARALQKDYLARYGLTLGGLMAHHGVDPDDFHAAINTVDLTCLTPDPDLNAALAALPGRKLIFTNADEIHAVRVLERLGMNTLFEDVFHIARAGFAPKPSPLAYERMITALALDPRRTVFFEDAVRNLAPAAALGMVTVLVGEQAAASNADFVSHRAASLADFLVRGETL